LSYIKKKYPETILHCVKINYQHKDNEFYKKKMIAKIKKVVINKNITHIICLFEEVFFIARIKEWLEKHCKILINTTEIYDTLHNKYNGYKFSIAHNIPTIPTMLLINDITKHQIETFIGKQYPAYVKEVYSYGGHGTHTCSDIGELFDSDGKIKDENIGRIIQPCIKGTIYTANVIYSKGDMIDKFILKSTTFINDTKTVRMPPFCEVIKTNIFDEYMRNIGKNTGYSGMLEVEFLVNNSGKFHLMEYNPRFSGSFICATYSDASIAKNYMNILFGLPIIPFYQKEIIYSFGIGSDIQYFMQQIYCNPKSFLNKSWLMKYIEIRRNSEDIPIIRYSSADYECTV
jgi:predicted ATP-grasp superfamily ATP-dependent carboligase